MLDLSHPRDLLMIGAIFSVAAFLWSGWAQEQPPRHLVYRFILGALAVAGIALAIPSILLSIDHWGEPTAISTGTTAFTVYIIVFWVEVIGGGIASFFAIRSGHATWIAPLILAIVGIHFFALAPVFGQPVLYLTGALITLAAIVAFCLPRDFAAPSFWCGILGAPVFLAIGLWCLLAGRSALAST